MATDLIVQECIHLQWVPHLYIGPSVQASIHLHLAEDPFGVHPDYPIHYQYTDGAVSVALVADDTYHLQTASDPFSLDVDNTYHAQLSDTTSLTTHILNIDTFHAHLSSSVVLSESVILYLDPDDTYHLQISDTPILDTPVVTDPPDCTHLHYVDGVVVIEGRTILEVSDCFHLHNVDHFDYALGDFVIISNSYHEQSSDRVPIEYTILNPTLVVNDCAHPHDGGIVTSLPIEFLPSIDSTVIFPIFDVSMQFGIYSEMTFPAMEMEGTITTSMVITGDLEFPVLSIESNIDIGVSINSDIIFPSITIDSDVGIGINITGDLEFPVFTISGEFIQGIEIDGDIILGAVQLNGSITIQPVTGNDEFLLTNKQGGSNWEMFA